MSFCIYDSDVAMCNNERVVIHNIQTNTENSIELPTLEAQKKIDLHNNVNIEAYHMITSVTFSNDGKYFLVCTNRKQLCLYERKSQTLLSNRTLVRAASKVRFAPHNDIVVADKAGDAYLFSTSNFKEDGILLLGHLSMLLDVLITEDEKYVITTDRDEKIRVSLFPNSYNIKSFCLGHNKFITNISTLPHDKSTLVSSGGDGVFILWDYQLGKELLSVDFRSKLSDDDIERFNQNLQDYHLEENIETLPVKHLRFLPYGAMASIAVLSFYNSPLLLVYNISGTGKTGFGAVYLQSLTIDSEPIECIVHKQKLWLLINSGFKIYEIKDNSLVPDKTLNCTVDKLNNTWTVLRKNMVEQNLFPILYKRKYDNVQEYLERKRTRLGNTVEEAEPPQNL